MESGMFLVIVLIVLVVLAFVMAQVLVRPVAPGRRPTLTASTSNSTDGGAVAALAGSSPTLDGCGHAGSSHSDGGYSDSGRCSH